jgi:dTDP-glucose 4,6-dehydratase
MKLLITGGCGFIGSNFIRYLINKYPDYEIINLDKLTYAGNEENLLDIKENPRYKFICADIADKESVEKILHDNDCIDVIVSFAAESHVDRSIMGADDFIKTNVYGVYVLLEAVKKFSVKKFLQISTDEVYGSIKNGKADESSPLNPGNPYSAAKAGGDLLALSYFNTFKLPVIITRSSNNFGPFQYPEKIIPLFITNLIEGKKVPLYGDGMNVRDWLFVLDNCEAIDLILHKGNFGEIYNIGAGSELTNLELTFKIVDLLGVDKEKVQNVKDRLGHDRRYALDSSKVKELGWKPKNSFDKAIKETVKWYQENKQWWKKIKRKRIA